MVTAKIFKNYLITQLLLEDFLRYSDAAIRDVIVLSDDALTS